MALRLKIEDALSYKRMEKNEAGVEEETEHRYHLPEGCTIGQAKAMALSLAELGIKSSFNFNLQVAVAEANRIDGTPTSCVEEAEPQVVSGMSREDELYAKFMRVAIENSRDGHYPVAALNAIADKAGVDLGLPRELPPASLDPTDQPIVKLERESGL